MTAKPVSIWHFMNNGGSQALNSSVLCAHN